MNKKITYNEVIAANIEVHNELVKKGEYQKSPHFFEENKKKVKTKLEKIISNLSSKDKMIDFGCGTGFLIQLIHQNFTEVHGVDISAEMMKHVDTSSGNVFLHESIAEKTTFDDSLFDFASCYSFMDHLLDYKPFLEEVFRVLKRGGIFYSGLNPNKDFILGMSKIEKSITFGSSIIDNEIKKALHNSEYYKNNLGLSSNLLDKAEPIKSLEKGFNFNEVLEFAKTLGFSNTEVTFDWFLGQSEISKKSLDDVEIIEEYLQSLLPFSSPCYKYLSFIFTK